jgi:WD40 repeat protein
LRWSFGFTTSVSGAVHNLSTAKRQALLYVSSHTGVIHDIEHDTQFLLQGHCNPITSVCVSKDKRWIATADKGEGAMIVVWDSRKGVPVKIINKPYANGIACMDMSTDAMYLLTISEPSCDGVVDEQQEIAVWEWTRDTGDADLKPSATAPLGAGVEPQHCVRFNPIDVRDIVSNGARKVIFWSWSDTTLTAFHPPKGTKKLKANLGALTQTAFIPYTTKVVTATMSSHVVLWNHPVSDLEASGRDAIKIMKLTSSAGITRRWCDGSCHVHLVVQLLLSRSFGSTTALVTFIWWSNCSCHVHLVVQLILSRSFGGTTALATFVFSFVLLFR